MTKDPKGGFLKKQKQQQQPLKGNLVSTNTQEILQFCQRTWSPLRYTSEKIKQLPPPGKTKSYTEKEMELVSYCSIVTKL